MKYFVTLITLAAIAGTLADEPEAIKGKRVNNNRGGRWFYYNNPGSTCLTSPPGTSYCLNGASCNPGEQRYTCVENYGYTNPTACSGATPYCTGLPGSARCTAFPDDSCNTGVNYPCQNLGYYPDFYDPYTFYYCYFDSNQQRIIPYQFSCSPGYPFNPAGVDDYKCVKGTPLLPTCNTNEAVEWSPVSYVGYTPTNKMAAYCNNGKVKYIYDCPPGMAFKGNLFSNTPPCVIVCAYDMQRAPYMQDITKYYECRGGIAYLMNCLPGKRFNPTTSSCF